MVSALQNGDKMLVADEDLIDMLTCSENSQPYEFSLLETPTSHESTSAVVNNLEHIVEQIKNIIQNDVTEIKSMCIESNETIERLLQSQMDLTGTTNEMVPKSELLVAQNELEECQELIRTIKQQQTCTERIAQVPDAKGICGLNLSRVGKEGNPPTWQTPVARERERELVRERGLRDG
jgi:tRNA U34 5-carboxymethylaminomethyl modifying GTPase MnmE/TrmE